VRKRGLEDAVKVKKCSCLGACRKAPVVQVELNGEDSERMKPKRAKKIIKGLAEAEPEAETVNDPDE
jgi:NADH:ubiquinone oxidoreductase subunit E